MALALTEKWKLAKRAALRMDELDAQVEARTDALLKVCQQLKEDIQERQRADKERAEIEGQMRQLQRVESIGQLAGAVAHDFNNILTPIVGYAEMILDELESGNPHFDKIEQILKSALHARALTQQLLAFSRKQVLDVRVLNANDLLSDIVKLIGRLIGEQIEMVLELDRSKAFVRMDPSQFQQIAVNLAVNARDAMPRGGTLTLRTYTRLLDDEFCRMNPTAQPGEYVGFSATDTGCGMDTMVLAHIFEPFFTTKAVGTGLGLATVHRIVRDHNGVILAESQPGVGSTFSILLPRVCEGVEPPKERRDSEDHPADRKTVLVVEDDVLVRRYVCQVLKSQGYRVLDVSSPYGAIALFEGNSELVDVLLSDVVLPQMSGTELYQRLSEVRPGLPVLYMSGYPRGHIETESILEHGIHFLYKPFTAAELAQGLREALAPQKETAPPKSDSLQ